jgi:hypothetical protein
MLRTRGTTLVPVKVDELFISSYEKIAESFDHNITNIIETLERKIADIKSMNQVKPPPGTTGAAGY